MEPLIVKNVLSESDFAHIVNYFKSIENFYNQPADDLGRRLLSDKDHPILKEYSNKLLPLIREFAQDDSLLPSYSLFSEYSEKEISLFHHKDKNACTYTIDIVLYQDVPWGLWVEGKEYILQPNEALLFLGEDQEHWRETVTNNTNKIGLIFFHYVKKDHWWFGNPAWKMP